MVRQHRRPRRLLGLLGHGEAAPADQWQRPAARDGRYGLMFPDRCPCDPGERSLDMLAAAMAGKAGTSTANFEIPAGYTYLGQFVDHDITFEPTSTLEHRQDPKSLVNFRTPRFDLDPLYGSGPIDQPFLYDWNWEPHPGVKLLEGCTPRDRQGRVEKDVPRNFQGRALIGDARNDDNVVISQLHLLFIRFHNKVVDHLYDNNGGGEDSRALFEEAQRLVRWHYQWIVIHDLLPRIIGRAPSADRRFFEDDERPFIPVEFSAAAYRFGHSMVRGSYILNEELGRRVPVFAPNTGVHLGGFRVRPASMTIDWRHFFELVDDPEPQSSALIDPFLAPTLLRLPPDRKSLAKLNLQRGRVLGLPSGQDVAVAIGAPRLEEAELVGPLEPLPDTWSAARRKALVDAERLWSETPLWYYVLCEAKARGGGGERLGDVGARIVETVLTGLLYGDPQSYVRKQPSWKPELAPDGDFTMPDLVRFALE